jgi:hypothetical protein
MNTIETQKALVSLLEGNIVRIMVKNNSHLETDDILEINKVKRRLVEDRKHSVLLLSGNDTTISPEARELSAAREIGENRCAKAIVTTSFAQVIIGNFFIRFNRPPGAVRLFVSEKDARAWLDQFI